MPVAVPMLALMVVVQANGSPGGQAQLAGTPPAMANSVVARRAVAAVVIDGKDDDAVWREAPAITAFREFSPREDGPPRFATAAKVAYDDRNFYAFIRAFDPHPDSILKILARRDVRAPTDQLKIVIDSYHDRRTGYEFAVNPAGVKRDYAIYNDNHEDDAWDGVWQVATTVDSLGWTAEFRIPLSQLRYAHADTNTFGFAVWRDIQRYTERVSWPVYRQSQSGFASQLGDVTGLVGLPAPRRLEVAPYMVTKNVSVPTGPGFDRSQKLTAGADLKYGLTSNVTLDATVNPDFGQVEADPAVLNLTAFETFFQERRPFFVAGTGVFRFDVNCSQVNCNGERLFYSRRIGRAPELPENDPGSPIATTIYGAAKVTGRLPGGQTVGVLDAVTQRATGSSDRTTEPATNYAVLRGQQDFRKGQSGVGVMFTAVNRSLDPLTDAALRRSAYVGALDFRHRFLNSRYQVSGSLDLSQVTGTAVPLDSTRTSLAGDAEELLFGKVGGGITRFETSYQRRSPGFEVNDLGFLLRADQQSWNNWFGVQSLHPSSLYQTAFWNFNWWQFWNGAGLPLERAANTNVHVQLNNRWWLHAGTTLGHLGPTFDDRRARGGPAVRVDPIVSSWAEWDGDSRPVVVPALWTNYWRGDGGRSESVNLGSQVSVRIASQFNTTIGVSVTHNIDNTQPFSPATDSTGTTHYPLAHLDQKTLSFTGRVDYTVTPELTLQIYVQPFVSKGMYSNPRELADPRAAAYDDRFKPYSGTLATGFNFKQFNSNVVLRWEYRPGSTLFVVWTQGRGDFLRATGTRSFAGDFSDLFTLHPDNTFLVKASYWLNW